MGTKARLEQFLKLTEEQYVKLALFRIKIRTSRGAPGGGS